MTTELHKLKPSTIAPIPIEVLRGLPVGGIYLYSIVDFEAILKVDRFSGGLARCSAWDSISQKWLPSREARIGRFQYLKLPALTFPMTIGQVSDRSKTVTRRKNIPKWAQPGRLFMAWDRSFRGGAGKARGLGIFRVVSAVRQGRYACNSCHGILEKRDERWICPQEPGETVDLRVENLYPAELTAEGFPDMSPDDFWSMLEKAGNVREDGTVARIQFESV